MDVVIPYQKQILEDAIPGVEKSHAIENFRIAAGESQGEFYGIRVADSDVAELAGSAAFLLSESCQLRIRSWKSRRMT